MSSAEPLVRPLEQRWREYRLLVVPANASRVQETCTRQAFYAGMASMFDAIVREAADLPDATAEKALEQISKEIRAYAANPT
ncbi:hypothetical protein [uncultured Arenimonas sp.]|uniref:hypothetical protein n=1 Tax=uncultured Arenimonas sp. TaxID=546226 RepID=UPI0030D6E49E